jgi:CheY-like chemotaxis protein
MVNMAAFRISELDLTGVVGSAAFQRNQSFSRTASRPVRRTEIGQVWASRRVLRVLLVNDEQSAVDGLSRLVRGWGYTSYSAHDGHIALRAAAVQHPNVVLLDIEVPFMDGYQVARQLRLDFPRKECFIIAVTWRADDEHRRQCQSAGVDLVLLKPVDPFVVETLLLLECELANRSRARSGARVDSECVFPFTPEATIGGRPGWRH